MLSYNMQTKLEQQWYEPKPWGVLLAPFAKAFEAVSNLRKYLYKSKILARYKSTVPLVVVGNITVGGGGKTPFVIALAKLLKEHGYKPGIVSRGYKGIYDGPFYVSQYSDPKKVGDEPVLLAKQSSCPVMIAKTRSLGIAELVKHHNVDIVLSDDGLQHYAIIPDISIALVDSKRMFGNGKLLPQGPLREKVSSLKNFDFVLQSTKQDNSYYYINENLPAYMLNNKMCAKDLSQFEGQTVHAIAGIANPQKFFEGIESYGIKVIKHPFADHHSFSNAEIDFSDQYPIFMTEKDAVKCQRFANPKHWVVPIVAKPSADFCDKFIKKLQELSNAR